ncbi:MAG TPA: hypothetical protein DCL54_19635 [Alphaproteobacteria bacterium]|jgi:hypothetical protein|nr:hypothetical protein [Alphaproteobacteria bacterium]
MMSSHDRILAVPRKRAAGDRWPCSQRFLLEQVWSRLRCADRLGGRCFGLACPIKVSTSMPFTPGSGPDVFQFRS